MSELARQLGLMVRAELEKRDAEIADLRERLMAVESRKSLTDAGVWRSTSTYSEGQAVTYDGSLWVAQVDEPGPPGKDLAGWRLAVRKGRDAK
jgi:hypothetical protein